MYAIVDHSLFMVTCVTGWIKYCVVNLKHGMWDNIEFPDLRLVLDKRRTYPCINLRPQVNFQDLLTGRLSPCC
jgi:hypothetical protein